MTADEISDAAFANSLLKAAEGVLAKGGIPQARENYRFAIRVLQGWLSALDSDDQGVRERALRQVLPTGIDRFYLATEPFLGLFRTSRYLNDLSTARQAGKAAIRILLRVSAESAETADRLAEVGGFMVEQDDPELRTYGQQVVEVADRLREFPG